MAVIQIRIDTADKRSLSGISISSRRGGMERVKGYVSPDGLKKLEIFKKLNGLFQFEESVVELIVEPDAEFFEEGTTYWNCTHLSGLHDSIESADAEAKASLPWLRDGSYLEA